MLRTRDKDYSGTGKSSSSASASQQLLRLSLALGKHLGPQSESHIRRLGHRARLGAGASSTALGLLPLLPGRHLVAVGGDLL